MDYQPSLAIYELAHRVRESLSEESVRSQVCKVIVDVLTPQFDEFIAVSNRQYETRQANIAAIQARMRGAEVDIPPVLESYNPGRTNLLSEWPLPVEHGIEASPGCLLHLAGLNDFASRHKQPFHKNGCEFTELRPFGDGSEHDDRAWFMYETTWIAGVSKLTAEHIARFSVVIENALFELQILNHCDSDRSPWNYPDSCGPTPKSLESPEAQAFKASAADGCRARATATMDEKIDEPYTLAKLISEVGMEEKYRVEADEHESKIDPLCKVIDLNKYYKNLAYVGRGIADKVRKQWRNKPGVQRLHDICLASGAEWSSKWLEQQRAKWGLERNVESVSANALSVAEFVEWLRPSGVVVADSPPSGELQDGTIAELQEKVAALEKQNKAKLTPREKHNQERLKFIRTRLGKKTWQDMANDWRAKPPHEWKAENLADAMRLFWRRYGE